ncbi:MAG: type VI secretion system Vgr family protein, partial [Candidatus Aminicenantaceae bacterium]
MVKYSSNQPFYELQCSELEEDALRVLSFQGEEKISRLFRYTFELLSEDPELDPVDILNKKAMFVLHRGDEDPLKIFGIISHFEQRGRSPSYVSYYAELVPKMWLTGLTFRNEIYQNMNVEKIVTEVLKIDGLAAKDFEFDLSGSYPDLEYVSQYRETNFDFINRWCERFGIFYFFDHKDDNDVIVFTDDNEKLPAIEQEEDLPYNPNRDPLSEKETIAVITCQSKVVTGLHQVKDYNYRHPSRDLKAESQIDSEAPGMFYDYGDHYKEVSEGEAIAVVRNEETVAQSKVFKGESDCRLFHAGSTFKMAEHYRDDWNEIVYILTQVRSRGSQQGLFAFLTDHAKIAPSYVNEFLAIPNDIAFRPERITKKPRISGFMNAKIDAGGDGQYAELDDQGRYKVTIPYDLSGNSGGEATQFIRMAQPYAGAGYGMHFPLHKDTEVALTFVDGDPDRPVIMNSLTNPATTSPVTSSNQTQSQIRDNGNNEIVLESADGGQIIHIKQSCGHEIKMDAGGQKIELRDTYGNEIVLDSGGGTITLYSPTNDSKIVLGKSIDMTSTSNIKTNTAADWIENVAGKAKVDVGGDVLNLFMGIKNEVVLGAKSEFLGGVKNEVVRAAVISNFSGLKSEIVKGTVFENNSATKYESDGASSKEKSPSYLQQVAQVKHLFSMHKANIKADKKEKVGGTLEQKATTVKEIGSENARKFANIKESSSSLKTKADSMKLKAASYKLKADNAKLMAN